jgi:Fe-S-cluster containining protein
MPKKIKKLSIKEPKTILKKYKKLLVQLDTTSSSRFEKVQKIHKFIDQQSAEMFQKQAVCKKGCSYCCSINVDVPEVEAAYIAENIGKTIKDQYIVGIQQKNQYSTPCPFLNQANQMCIIYDFRPSVCRSYFVFNDPKLCEQEIGQREVNINSSSLVSHLFSNYLIFKLSNNISINFLHAETRDIREWF